MSYFYLPLVQRRALRMHAVSDAHRVFKIGKIVSVGDKKRKGRGGVIIELRGAKDLLVLGKTGARNTIRIYEAVNAEIAVVRIFSEAAAV